MDQSNFKCYCLIALCFIYLQNLNSVHGLFMKFTNITCQSNDLSLSSVQYCYIGHVDHLQNFMSVRYMLPKPLQNNIFWHFRFMIKSNGWKPFMYALDLEMCRFLKARYNALGKMLFGFLDGHTNMNHSCPYTNEKYLSIDRVMNTDVSKRLPSMPIGKGHYGIYTSWSWNNITRAEIKVYFEFVHV